MRRADRLMGIVHFLRSRHRAVTARQIAEEFGICTRTVYRDIQDLVVSGAPINGEAGVGYIIDKQYYLPPVAFDADELEAISLGITMVRQWTDDNFSDKADSALRKIQAILPARLQGELQQITTWSSPGEAVPQWTVSFSQLRECIRKRHKVRIVYCNDSGQQSSRTVRPLALVFFNPVWLLAGWCEKRQNFRNFRLDRILTMQHSDNSFADENGKDLKAYRKQEQCF